LWADTHLFSIFSSLAVLHNPIDLGKQSVVFSHPDIDPRMDSGPDLANKDAPCPDLFAAEPFDAETLSSTVSTVP
jgi:hypothetical protein